MPLDNDFFANNADGSLIRSEHGLAYSDAELNEIRSWVEDRDLDLINLSSELAALLSLVAKALEPVSRPPISSRGFDYAIAEHKSRIGAVKWKLDTISEKFMLPNLRFMERHVIPRDLRASIHPQDFDGSRNDQAIWDAHLKTALESLETAKAIPESRGAGKVASVDTEEGEALDEALEGYLSLIVTDAADAFRQRMALSADFAELAKEQMSIVSKLFGVASMASDKQFEKVWAEVTKTLDVSDADIASMAWFHVDRAAEVFQTMKSRFDEKAVDTDRALSRIANLRQMLGPKQRSTSTSSFN